MEVDNNVDDELVQSSTCELVRTESFSTVAQNEERIQQTFAEEKNKPTKIMRIIHSCSNVLRIFCACFFLRLSLTIKIHYFVFILQKLVLTKNRALHFLGHGAQMKF